MGDLMSDSPVLITGAEITVADGIADDTDMGKGIIATESSGWAAGAPPFKPRLRRSFEFSCSSSNSVMEFFFIKSMMALISFKSTVRFR
jgi:hypothetical protein